jgi:hypothetical protein
MSRTPNPQGKGLVPIMESLDASRPCIVVPAKSIEQVGNELFTSMFVLESEFKFRPVVNKTYWLYRHGDRFRLSLVGPQEWGASQPLGQCIGECVLHADMTWSLALQPDAAGQEELMELIAERRAAFERQLQAVEQVQQVLPVFQASLPFYQRVFAAGLACSLGESLRRAGIAGLSYDAARRALPDTENPPADEPD